MRAKLQNKVLGLLIIPIATGLVTAFGVSLGRPVGTLSHVYLYLLIIVVAALWWGQVYGLYAVSLAVLAIVYFFVPPRGSFEIDPTEYKYTSEALGMLIFLTLALFTIYLISSLAEARRQAQKLAASERQSREATELAYYALELQQKQTNFLQKARQLLDDTLEPEISLSKVITEFQELYGGNFVLTIYNNSASTTKLTDKTWEFGNIQLNSASDDAISDKRYLLPLRVSGQQLGQLVYYSDAGGSQTKEKSASDTLITLAQYIATALETAQLYRTLEFQNNEIAQLLHTSLRTDSTLDYRADQLSIFYRLLSAVISGLEQRPLMSLALSEAGRVLNYSVGAVLLLDQAKLIFNIVALRGELELELQSLVNGTESLPGMVIGSGQPFHSNNLAAQTDFKTPILSASIEQIQSCIYVPIQNKTEKLGVVIIGSDKANQYQAEDVDFLVGLANLLATAILNQQLYEERERAAGLTERNRIARNLHDGLAQSINYIGLKTQLIEELYAAGEHSAVGAEIERIAHAAQMARSDVREALYGLLHTSRDRTLPLALTDLVREVGELSGLKINLKLPENNLLPYFSLATQSQLLRIVQEAISNVQKHAKATEVTILVEYQSHSGNFCLSVSDNGVGFDLASVKKANHYGLDIMRERAKSLGAYFALNSYPGQGTTLTLHLEVKKEIDTKQH